MSSGAITIVAICIAVCAASLVMPWVGYVGYASFAVLAPHQVWKDSLQGTEMQKFLSGLMILGFAITGFRSQKLAPGVKYVLVCYTIYIITVLLGSGVQINPISTARFVDISWKMWLMSCIGIMLLDRGKKVGYLMFFVMLASAWNAWELNQRYLRQGFIRSMDFYFNGMDNNVYSVSVLPVTCFTLAFLVVSKDFRMQCVAGFVLALQLHQVMILESRGTMIGALACGILAAVFMPKNPRTIGMAVVVTILVGILAGPPVIKEFMSSFEKGDSLDGSAESRFKLWKAGAAIMKDHPLGVGPWCGELYVPRYYEGYSDERERKALHNLFFEVGTGMGIPGVSAYLAMFIIPWFMHLRFWKSKKRVLTCSQPLEVANLAALMGIPGYWLASMFSSGALIESPYIMLVVSCASISILQRGDDVEYRQPKEEDADEEEMDDYRGDLRIEDDGELVGSRRNRMQESVIGS